MECKAGERVKVVDNTSAHGKIGTVLRVNVNGLIIVELENGVTWPTFPHEIETITTKDAPT
jgi:hypothetical protein